MNSQKGTTLRNRHESLDLHADKSVRLSLGNSRRSPWARELVCIDGVKGCEDARKTSHPCERCAGYLHRQPWVAGVAKIQALVAICAEVCDAWRISLGRL